MWRTFSPVRVLCSIFFSWAQHWRNLDSQLLQDRVHKLFYCNKSTGTKPTSLAELLARARAGVMNVHSHLLSQFHSISRIHCDKSGIHRLLDAVSSEGPLSPSLRPAAFEDTRLEMRILWRSSSTACRRSLVNSKCSADSSDYSYYA